MNTMSRQERRRLAMKKDPTLTIKQSDLNRMIDDAVKNEAAKLAKKAKDEAIQKLFGQLLAVPVMVIHDHFGALMKKEGREERFAEMCLDLFDTVEKGYVTPQELMQCLKEETGMRIKERRET